MLELTAFEKLALNVMKQGHVPEHIAFIMDGNRRFAQNKHSKALSGHEQGAMTLKRCLLYCLHLGVKYASFYAFSIQNYKRSKDEVQFLMNLARSEFRKLSEIYEQDNILEIIQRNNVKVIIAGDLQGKLKETFPDVRQGFLKIQERTKTNTRMTMYLCFAYDSIYEYNQAVSMTKMPKQAEKEEGRQQDREGDKLSEDKQIDQFHQKQAVFEKLMVPHYIDILIRTSGESRLSNYMLMQANYGLIYIQKNFWPAFSMYTLGKILLQYNYYFNDINGKKIKFTQS